MATNKDAVISATSSHAKEKKLSEQEEKFLKRVEASSEARQLNLQNLLKRISSQERAIDPAEVHGL